MPPNFTPRLAALPGRQLALWPELSQAPSHFMLYGGTALALHLGHRTSVDFNLFGANDMNPDQMLATMAFLRDATVLRKSANTLDVLVERDGPVKLSFFGVPALKRLRPPHVCPGNNLRVASLLDLAGTKASIVQQRSEAKDYLDIAAIVADGRVTLPMALSAGQAIHGRQFNPQVSLKALSYFGDGDLATLPQATRDIITCAVRRVDPRRLPSVAPAAAATLPRDRTVKPIPVTPELAEIARRLV